MNPNAPDFSHGQLRHADAASGDEVRPQHLASLGNRFLGAVIDFGLGFAALMLGSPLIFLDPAFGQPDSDPGPLGLAGAGISLVAMISLVAVQWYWISTLGQSIGKRVVKIQIRKLDGSEVDFVTGVILRVWLIGLMTGFVNLLTCGLLGWVVYLADSLMIFGADRRCLHDLFASTKVIELTQEAEPPFPPRYP